MVRYKYSLAFTAIFLLIFCSITGAAFGTNLDYNKSVQAGDCLNPELSNVNYDNYDYFFGLFSYGNTIINRYGKLPDLETEEQKESWESTLEELSEKIKNTVASEYMYPNGEVVTCGTNVQGYFVILFKYGNVDEPLIDEIYTLIDNAAKEMDIQDIPVEFGYGIYQAYIPLEDLGRGIYHTYGENVEKLSESDIQTIEEYMKKKPEKLGGGGIVCYGKIPLLKDRKDIKAWGNKISSIKYNTEEKISPYFRRGEVVMSEIGLTRLSVHVYDGLPSENKIALTEEIYQIIDEEARKQNVTDIPVVFGEGGRLCVRTDERKPEDRGMAEESVNLKKSGEKSSVELNNSESDNSSSSIENESSKSNSVPSFGLLGSLICLYGGWKLRKK